MVIRWETPTVIRWLTVTGSEIQMGFHLVIPMGSRSDFQMPKAIDLVIQTGFRLVLPRLPL